ncbi:uncharacterized protein LOC111867995 isoform X4 [Cryptotermes secundus]|uniref:uncharacterized protein LOC111867995 isoform X4 n=1 Tax=Cryptotermes secundus TaxID=105785 RepID=UPI001454D307|nr:uncharacterized protein LOC111867995 isoform X4 [Cryptotermes secundus]
MNQRYLDSVISRILEQGQRLRDAMVRSVLEDDIDNGIDVLQSGCLTDKMLSTGNEGRKVFFDDAKVIKFLSGKTMTQQDEEYAMERLKNMPSVASFLEMVRELGMKEEVIVENDETPENESSKMAESELEAVESSVPFSEEGISHEITKERGIHNTGGKEVNVDPLESDAVLQTDLLMKIVDSLKITVHSLAIDNNERNKYQNCVQLDTRKMNFLHELSMQRGTFYFVEFELLYPYDLGVRRETKVVNEGDETKHAKSSRPWHSKVKRFCSRKKIGSDIYFGQSSLYILPTSKTSFCRLLRDGNITFRVYSRHLHQKLPLQIGEACLRMTDILKSESFIFHDDIEILYRTKIPECQVHIGVLKITVQLGSGQRNFGNNFLNKLNSDGMRTEVVSDCENMKPGASEHKREANLKPVSDTRLAPRHHASSISRRIIKNNGSSGISCDVIKENQFCKNSEQEIGLDHRVADSSLSETRLNEPVLLHSLLHISEGQGFDGLNSYLVCRAFWKDDIITSDICCMTGNPRYNFHELIPVLMSKAFLDRSQNNVLVVELWERRFAADCDLLIGIAKLPLNKFFVAYRDPVVAAQLLLSKYPVIAVDGWVTVYNPVTRLPAGQLHAILALGTEDQVWLLKVTRLDNSSDGVRTTSTGKLTSMVPMPTAHDSNDGIQTAHLGGQMLMEPTPATYSDNHSIQTSSVGEHTSVEPFPCSIVNHYAPVFSGNSKSQARHINNSASVISELPQRFYDHAYASASLQQCSYHNSDSVPTLGTQEPGRDKTVDVRDLTKSLPHSPMVSHEVNSQCTEFWQSSFDNVERHLSFQNTKTAKHSVQKSCAIQNQRPSLAFKHPVNRKEQYPQGHSFQHSADKLMVKNHNVGSSGTKDFSQSTRGQQVKQSRLQSKGDQSLQSGTGWQTDDIINVKPSNKETKTRVSTKHQESQAGLPTLDVTTSETVTLQNTSKSTETYELLSDLPLDIIYEACVSSTEVLNVQPDELSDSQSPSFSQNEHTNEGVSSKELSSQCTEVSSQGPFKLINYLKDGTGGGTNKITYSESERTDLNADSFLGIDSRASDAQQCVSVLDDLEASKSAEADPESSFHVHVEIERAMHLQYYRQNEGDEAIAGKATEPSTYVTFLLKQGSANESELQMFTPLASHSANPSWCWHCDTWLSSDLLTNNCERMIFKVWQSVNGSCKDPVRDVLLGFAAVDLTVLLYGMPLVSGWFSITDFSGLCRGHIKISIMPLENLSNFNQCKIPEPKMTEKLQGNCCGKHRSGCVDCQQVQDEEHNEKQRSTVTHPCGVSDNMYSVSHVPSETSAAENSEIFTSRTSHTHSASLHPANNGLSGVRRCSLNCDAGLQGKMTSSLLSQALTQKLSELDEITQRLKKRLHFVTDEGSTQSFLTQIQETEISFRPETASNNISNTEGSKNLRGEISPENEGNSDLGSTVANSPEVTAGSKYSEDPNNRESVHFKVAKENYKIPQISSQKYENFKNSMVYSLPSNNFVYISSTNSYPLPQSNVSNIQGYLPKRSENHVVRRTPVNHMSLLANASYPDDSSSCKKISSHLRTQGNQIHNNWNEGVSKTVSNGTSGEQEMRSDAEDTDDFDKLTDYLMETSARELELENVFNPLLFHQLLSTCNEMYISGFNKQHHVGCHHVSSQVRSNAQPNKDSVKICSDYDDTTHADMEVDVASSEHLMYILEENTHVMNDSLCIKSNEGNHRMNEAGTMERNVGMTKENRTQFHTDGEIMANVSSASDMNLMSAVEVSNMNQSSSCDISLDIVEQQYTIGDITCSCLPCVCLNSKHETGNRAISELQVSHTIGNSISAHPRTSSSSDVAFSNCSVNKLESLHGEDLDENSQETAFVLRQAPEGGNTMEEKKTVNAKAVLEGPVEIFRISKPFHSTEGQKQGENICTNSRTSSVRDEECLNNTFLRPTQLTPSCFKHRNESGAEGTEMDLLKEQERKKQMHSLINAEKIQHVAKIFNTNLATQNI